MDLIGHCAVALASGLHDETEVFEGGLPEMMLPNIMHCHDWAYSTVWELDRFPDPLRDSARRIRSHIVADWVIHYGAETTRTKRKCGWAYRRMGFVNRRAVRFFDEADFLGLLNSDAVHPDRWNKKRRLDFAHSIIEYAADFLIAPDFMSPSCFRSVKRELAALDRGAPGDARARLQRLFSSLGAWSDVGADGLERSLDGMAYDAATAETPEDFAVLTTIRKYGFNDGRASRAYVRGFLDAAARELDQDEVSSLVERLSRLAADPDAIYDGPLGAEPVPAFAGAA
ncbi:MAG TPA: hypothetical protein VF619_09110 [Allosphingosinicella sp.]